jgi:hypothetical protein
MIMLCKRFGGYDPSISPNKLFGKKVAECLLALSDDPNDIALAKQELAESAHR